MIRLNLGSGASYNDGMLNVDMDLRQRADLRWDIRRLPFEPGSILEIHALHVIEHLAIDEYRAIVQEWAVLLCGGGAMTLSGPDVVLLTERAATGELSARHWARDCFAWVTGAPKGWEPPTWAESFVRPESVLERAVAALRRLPPAEFVQWFNAVLFHDGERPAEWRWLHRSAHAKDTVLNLLTGVGLSIAEAKSESGRTFAVYGRKP